MSEKSIQCADFAPSQRKQPSTPHHSRPIHKVRKNHLKKLQALGIDNFAQVDIPYWEPQLLNDNEVNTKPEDRDSALQCATT